MVFWYLERPMSKYLLSATWIVDSWTSTSRELRLRGDKIGQYSAVWRVCVDI